MTALIGLSGYARSGKDTVGRVLVERGWERRSFADKVREFLLALDPIVDAEVWSDCYPANLERLSEEVARSGWEEVKDEYSEVRELLQRCGTEAGRKVLGEEVWINATLSDLEPFTPIHPYHAPFCDLCRTGGHGPATGVVVTDVRFPNEARAIRDRGGVIARIVRKGVGPKMNENGAIHSSEIAMDDYEHDVVIHNSGTLGDLRDQALRILL